MNDDDKIDDLRRRHAPIAMRPDVFRAVGHKLVDDIADFLMTLPAKPVTPGETPKEVRAYLPSGPLPEEGTPPDRLVRETAQFLFHHSLFNGHPRYFGYINPSPAPIGALADLLAAAVNPNVGAWELSPAASEIEAQCVRWISELIGFRGDCCGLLVSGGNVANFVGFLAARRSRLGADVRRTGLTHENAGKLLVYASEETHTWILKAADLFGHGTDLIRWIPVNEKLQADVAALRKQIDEDTSQGARPFLLVGTAGSVSTGALDPLPELAAVARETGMWFHIDGAYGAFAAAVPDAPRELSGIGEADSIAVDPHKWLYAPLEAGCVLVREPDALPNTFSYRPSYYHFHEKTDEPRMNYYEYGLQNSRGFRALKVWLGLRHVGRRGYAQMIADDIRLAGALYRLAEADPELETFTHGLSITTFRYVPSDLSPGTKDVDDYLDELNTELLNRMQQGGEAYLSNAVIDGKFVLRACVVNFRTTLDDIEELPAIVKRIGKEVDRVLRPMHF